MKVQTGEAQLRLTVLAFLLLSSLSFGCCFRNEVSALLAFKRKISLDPYGVLDEWRVQEGDSLCSWKGITCIDGRVTQLELRNSFLRGSISPELSELKSLQKIDLGSNKLHGPIPRKLWFLKNLKFLDLSVNRLSGVIPREVENLVNLQELNLARNHLEGVLPKEFVKLVNLAHLHLNDNRITGSILEYSDLCNLKKLETLYLSSNALEGEIPSECLIRHPSSSFVQNSLYSKAGGKHNIANCGVYRRLLQSEPSKNATRDRHQANHFRQVHQQKIHDLKKRQLHSHLMFGLLFALPVLVAALVVLVIGVFFYKRRTAAVSPWKAGMSGHLQKVFVTDVPMVSWAELQSACEDFSNIIGSSSDSVVFKGTLSNGTEVAVTSIRILAANWTASSEIFFRRKIEALARMKHTHLVNLLGYCAEEEPFARMLLFEYAPNGTLSEHLHNESAEHLDWAMRMRIVMGAAYGLEYMHHDLVPPASHSNFDCNAIYLTEDYAAKLADFGISRLAIIKSDRRKSFSNNIGYDDFEGSDRHSPDFENNIFSFGLFLLEVVTGRLAYTEKEGSLLEWALDFLTTPETLGYMVDPSLKSFDAKHLIAICNVVRLCVQPDSSKRPTMKVVVSMLAKELNLSPQAAQPKSSPLLWAELEILSPC